MPAKIAASDAELFDLVQESILTCGLDGRITGWNAASERLYGWGAAETLGRQADELLKTAAQPAESLGSALRESGCWEGELRRADAAGRKVLVRVKRVVRRGARGEPAEILETGIDVTPRRQAEEAFRRAQYRYDNIFRAMAVSFWELDFAPVGAKVQALLDAGVTDLGAYFASHAEFVREMIRSTRIIDVNDQSVLLFGRGDKQEMLAGLEPYWPEESFPVYAASVVAAYQGKPHYSTETRLQSIDGRQIETLFTASFPPEMVARGKLVVGIVDISAAKRARTELETSELRYRNLFHFVPVSLIQLDRTELADVFETLRTQGVNDLSRYIDEHPDFVAFAMNSIRIREVNRRTLELFAAEDAGQLLGPVARLWTESPDTFRRSMQARFQGAMRYEAEIRVRTFDDRVLDVLYVTDFPEGLRQAPLGLAALIDVTDRVKAQVMLERVQAEFAHAARVSMLGELTASIAHEVNQPLGAILTNGEAALRWLDRPVPDVAELRALSNRTIRDAQRAGDIIRRIRAMATRKHTEEAPISLTEMIREVMLFLGHELRRHNIDATIDLAPDLPDILGDRVQLQQVVANIAINAMQAMTDKPVRRLVIRTACPEPGTLRADIEDSGPGIAPDDLNRLFESFFTTKPGGMGIGLAICRSIIEAHGGAIEGGNRAEGGARFSVTLPVAPAPGARNHTNV
jgi:PAS domain S-box-containing protein